MRVRTAVAGVSSAVLPRTILLPIISDEGSSTATLLRQQTAVISAARLLQAKLADAAPRPCDYESTDSGDIFAMVEAQHRVHVDAVSAIIRDAEVIRDDIDDQLYELGRERA